MPESGDPEKYPQPGEAGTRGPWPKGAHQTGWAPFVKPKGGNFLGMEKMFFAAVNSFNAGELSPKMLGRPDVSQYAHGCRAMRNFLVTPYGAAERRPGTLFVAAVEDTYVRLIPFVFSEEVAYLCAFGDGFIRFYRNDVFITEIDSPYTHLHLDGISFIQSADVMWLCHESLPVQELRRTSETEFEISAMSFAYPPVLDPNLTDTTITPSAREGEITLSASSSIFEEGHVNSYWNLVHVREENEIAIDFKSDGVSDSLEVFGYWSLTTHGTWTGTLKIQRSFDKGSSWSDFRTYSSSKDSNVSTSGEEETRDVLYRLTMSDYEASSTGTIKYCEALLSNPDYETTGVVRIDEVTSGTSAKATVIQKLGDVTATKEWNEGAWSDKRGYPRAVSFYEERLMFGGSRYQPQTVWGSRINDWNNFLLSDLDDAGISFTLCSDTVNHIRWMCQHDSLIIGTSDSEWTLSASTKDAALTPSNVKVKRQSVYGSGRVRATMAGDVVLFVQNQGRKVREFVYAWEKDGYTSPDLTILADHITDSGICEIALQRQPDTLLWTLLNNGTLAVLTYERDQEVVGWQRVDSGGTIVSVAVLPGSGEDFVYIAIDRNGELLIERFAPRAWERIEDAVYTDSSVTVSGEAVTRITGLGHLEGKTVQILADGAEHPEQVVSGAGVDLETPCTHAVAGLAYSSLLSPMPIETDTQNGSSMLRRKNVAELRIRVMDSVGGEVRSGSGPWREIISRDIAADEVSYRIEPKSEAVQINPESGFEKETSIEIRQERPLPLTVASITALVEIVE